MLICWLYVRRLEKKKTKRKKIEEVTHALEKKKKKRKRGKQFIFCIQNEELCVYKIYFSSEARWSRENIIYEKKHIQSDLGSRPFPFNKKYKVTNWREKSKSSKLYNS